MSNSSIKTSAIRTIQKFSSLKRSLGNFCTLSSSQFPNPLNFKPRSPRTFVLQSSDKFILFYLMPMRCCWFRITHGLGTWTPLTSSPFSASSAMLGTGENGGWSTAVARWRMRYSLKQTSRQRQYRASEPCTNALALRVFACVGAHCIVCCLVCQASSSLTLSACMPVFRTTPWLSHC